MFRPKFVWDDVGFLGVAKYIFVQRVWYPKVVKMCGISSRNRDVKDSLGVIYKSGQAQLLLTFLTPICLQRGKRQDTEIHQTSYLQNLDVSKYGYS